VFLDRTVFFSHNHQPEQYFGLFFSPAEQALAMMLRLVVGLRSTLKDARGLEIRQASLLQLVYQCFVWFSPEGFVSSLMY
jgi:hypothetical protein